MQPIYLFDIASQQAQWLTVRQQTVSSNIANANTPGYRALDVKPFAEVMATTGMQMARTQGAHLDLADFGTPGVESAETSNWEVSASGNSVSLEQELMRESDVNRTYSLNTSLVKAFNRMLLMSVKTS